MDNQSLSEFYSFLKKNKLNGVNAILNKCETWDFTQILDFAREAHEILLGPTLYSNSLFTFSANSTLSGAPFPCFGPTCRLNNLESVVKFAALYADRVYIANPFEDYLYQEKESGFTRTVLAGDLLGMFYLRPFLEDGIIAIQNNISFLCEECHEERVALEDEILKEVKRAKKFLIKMYTENVKVNLTSREDEMYFSVSGPEHLIEHGHLDLIGNIPEPLLQNYTLGDKKELSKQEIRQNHLLDSFVNRISRDLFTQSIRVNLYETQCLTDRKVEADLISALDKPDIAQASKSLLDGLAHSVPTIEKIQPQKLLNLRRREGEAFEVYRDKLRLALSKSASLNSKEMKQMVQDEITPEIHKIEHTIKKEKRLLLNSLRGEIILGAGSIAIGLYSGLLSGEAKGIIASMAGGAAGAFLHSIGKKATRLGKEPDSVSDNPYYFLWRVKNI